MLIKSTTVQVLGEKPNFDHFYNMTKNTSKATIAFLKQKRVKVIEWINVFPDLNLMERYGEF